MKTCSNCKSSYPATPEFFHRNRAQDDGLHSHCKNCRSYTMAKLYGGNPKYLEQSRLYRSTLRLDVLTAYSGTPPQCACCGEHRLPFLALDHINGDGMKHRKSLGNTSQSIYVWLRNNDYPSGYRVLCHNCNMAYGFYGMCPHEQERSLSD